MHTTPSLLPSKQGCVATITPSPLPPANRATPPPQKTHLLTAAFAHKIPARSAKPTRSAQTSGSFTPYVVKGGVEARYRFGERGLLLSAAMQRDLREGEPTGAPLAPPPPLGWSREIKRGGRNMSRHLSETRLAATAAAAGGAGAPEG